MSLTEIKKVFEKRRFNLIRTLETGREEIELSKQHQMYGAIKEIENIMRTIEHYRELEIKENDNYEFKLSREPEKSLIEKISIKFKKKTNATQELTKM